MSADQFTESHSDDTIALEEDRRESSSSRPAPDPLIGAVLGGKYRIEKKIGEGGMGSVYLANHEAIDRKVAVKVLLGQLAADSWAIKRFQQEAKAVSKIQHPNTVTIYDYGQIQEDHGEERLYIVMEFLRGFTLTQVLRSGGPLDSLRVCRIIRQVCASLADAHGLGIIHRDLKPDNIFLTEVGGSKDWVKVLDFGVAKLADGDSSAQLTKTGMIFGTPKYMSPEQAEGKDIDYRTDIYAIGVVLYEMLAGRAPFIAETSLALLLKHISEPPPPLHMVMTERTIDPDLERTVMRALEKQPERRQQQVSELAMELELYERSITQGGRMHGGGVAVGPSSLVAPLGEGLVEPGVSHAPLLAPPVSPSSIPTQPKDSPVEVHPVTYPDTSSPREGLGDHRQEPRGGNGRRWMLGTMLILAGVAIVGIQQYRRPQPVKFTEATVIEETPKEPPPVIDEVPAVQTTTTPAPTPTQEPAPSKPQWFTAQLASSPPGAEVRVDGKVVGRTPTRVRLPIGRQEHVLVFRKRGYRQAVKRLASRSAQKIEVVLHKRRRTTAPARCGEEEGRPCTDDGQHGVVNQKVDDLK